MTNTADPGVSRRLIWGHALRDENEDNVDCESDSCLGRGIGIDEDDITGQQDSTGTFDHFVEELPDLYGCHSLDVCLTTSEFTRPF